MPVSVPCLSKAPHPKVLVSIVSLVISATRKNSPNVYKSCPKMISAPSQKMPKNMGDLGKVIVAKGFKNLPKVQ